MILVLLSSCLRSLDMKIINLYLMIDIDLLSSCLSYSDLRLIAFLWWLPFCDCTLFHYGDPLYLIVSLFLLFIYKYFFCGIHLLYLDIVLIAFFFFYILLIFNEYIYILCRLLLVRRLLLILLLLAFHLNLVSSLYIWMFVTYLNMCMNMYVWDYFSSIFFKGSIFFVRWVCYM